MSKNKIAIIGAGASGLMAAIAAATTANNASVTVFERLDKAGSKLLASGGGRSNLTNVLGLEAFLAAFGKNGRFMRSAMQDFPREDLCGLLQDLGVAVKCVDGFHIFPKSERALDVRDALLSEAKRAGVTFKYNCEVSALLFEDGKIQGLSTSDENVYFDSVIIACGGKAYPGLGGTGCGYELARQAGHKIIKTVPGMVALDTKETWPGECAGITLDCVELRIDAPKLRKQATSGTLLFTHNGISGPAAIDISGQVNALLQESGCGQKIILSPLPGKKAPQWRENFDSWAKKQPTRTIASLLGDLFPKRLASCLCEAAAEHLQQEDFAETRATELSKKIREGMSEFLANVPLSIPRISAFDKAMVTRGGVSLKEIDPRTMQSRLLEGLYFCGEVMDIDGPCGGYNLQWAFSSGHLAGKSAL